MSVAYVPLAMTEQGINLKEKTVKGMFWGSVDTFLTKGLNFIFNLLIARQLLPQDYGAIAILCIIMCFSQCFVDSGFGTALVRKNDRTEADYSTVFYFNIVVALIIYVIIFLASPYIAHFYNIPELSSVTKVYSITLIINAFAIIQNAKLTIDVNFKAFAKISLITAIISGIVGLWMASYGYGVWALVMQAVMNSLFRTILLWRTSKWTPKMLFSWKSFKDFFNFGLKILGGSLINVLYNNIYPLIIGKVYSPSSLGAYTRGENIAKFPSESAIGVIANVSFPVLSSIQDDEPRLKQSFREIIRLSSFIIFPLMIGVSAIADPFIRICLTDKWETTIPLLQILCFALIWNPITNLNYVILKIKGRSDYFFKVTIISKAIGLTILCLTVKFGLKIICLGQIMGMFINIPISIYFVNKVIGYNFNQLIIDTKRIFLLAFSMGVLVTIIVQLIPSHPMKLIIGFLLGAGYYILIAKLLKYEELTNLLEIITIYIKELKK